VKLQSWKISYSAHVQERTCTYHDIVRVAAVSMEQAIAYTKAIHPNSQFEISSIERIEDVHIAISGKNTRAGEDVNG
jgi:hypothetical protein